MALTAPTMIPDPPTAPDRTDKDTFGPRADAWTIWERDSLYPGIAAFALNVYHNAMEAQTSAQAAYDSAYAAAQSATASATSAANAHASELAAAASAATAIAAPGTSATSATSLTVGTGAKALTINTGKALVVGMSVKIASTATPSIWMFGDITSYDTGTGALVVNATATQGAGTLAAWTISLSGVIGPKSTGATVDLTDFAQDINTTTGLTYGYQAGRIRSDTTTSIVAAGTVGLTASTTNYVEATVLGVVSKNTVGFSSGSFPMARVVTGGAAITSVTDMRGTIGAWSPGNHEVSVYAGNGLGSTNTRIRRFATTLRSVGTAITYTDSATLGATFAINEPGIYAISYCELPDNYRSFGISLNSTQLTTEIDNINLANRLAYGYSYNAPNEYATAVCVVRLVAGDIVRPHYGGPQVASATNLITFSVRKIAI